MSHLWFRWPMVLVSAYESIFATVTALGVTSRVMFSDLAVWLALIFGTWGSLPGVGAPMLSQSRSARGFNLVKITPRKFLA